MCRWPTPGRAHLLSFLFLDGFIFFLGSAMLPSLACARLIRVGFNEFMAFFIFLVPSAIFVFIAGLNNGRHVFLEFFYRFFLSRSTNPSVSNRFYELMWFYLGLTSFFFHFGIFTEFLPGYPHARHFCSHFWGGGWCGFFLLFARYFQDFSIFSRFSTADQLLLFAAGLFFLDQWEALAGILLAILIFVGKSGFFFLFFFLFELRPIDFGRSLVCGTDVVIARLLFRIGVGFFFTMP